MKVLFIGDNDLISKRFNGYDYHDILLNYNIESSMLVERKLSKTDFVECIDPSIDNFTLSIIKNKKFIDADIVHLHLIHNTPFDINYLPLMTRLKPTVITLHDPFFLGGHCIHHFDCEKWKSHCADCEYLNIPFNIKYDDTALRFALKKIAINNSCISAIVASEWMNNLVKQSPIWNGKEIYNIPFGVNQNIFKPCNIQDAKEKLGIDKNSITIMFRIQNNIFKGIDILQYALKNINASNEITLIAVGEVGLLEDLKKKYKALEFNWITDDLFLSQLYQASDIFLMPSTQEAFGLMAAEAMCCGKMVLGTRNTALEHTINHPDCGIAVEHNAEAFARELQRLLNNIEEINIRSNKCHEFARITYNYEIFFVALSNTYHKIIKQHNLCISESDNENIDCVIQQLKKYNEDYKPITNTSIKNKNKKISFKRLIKKLINYV